MKDMWWMVKDSAGNKSATLTFALTGMVVTSIALLASLVDSVTVSETVVKMKEVDPTLFLGYLGATVTAYIIRRNKGDDLSSDEKNGVVR